MAILMLISTNQVREPFQFLADVVGIFEDSHSFTPSELERFDFITIMGGRDDVANRLNELDVKYAQAFFNETNSRWQFDDPMVTTQIIEVWSPDNRTWYQVVEPFKFRWNIGQLTAEEKQLLATFDIFHPSVESAARKLMKDLIAANPANGNEIKDLKNQTP